MELIKSAPKYVCESFWGFLILKKKKKKIIWDVSIVIWYKDFYWTMQYQLLVLMLEASDREEIRFSLLDNLKNKETLQYKQPRLKGYQNHWKQLHYIAGKVSWTAAARMHVKQSEHVWTKRTCDVMSRESGIQYLKLRNCFHKCKCRKMYPTEGYNKANQNQMFLIIITNPK